LTLSANFGSLGYELFWEIKAVCMHTNTAKGHIMAAAGKTGDKYLQPKVRLIL